MLVAWEVMAPSWRINQSKAFGEPAIDFVLATAGGDLLALELKTNIDGPAAARFALVEVTRRAMLLGRSATRKNLETAHATCYSGDVGRIDRQPYAGLETRHQRYFDLREPATFRLTAVERVLGAARIGRSAIGAIEEFNARSGRQLELWVREVAGEPGARGRDAQKLLKEDGMSHPPFRRQVAMLIIPAPEQSLAPRGPA